MQTKPWFSNEKKRFAYEHKETVYHDNSACTEGIKISKVHVEPGTGGRPHCKECTQLSESEL